MKNFHLGHIMELFRCAADLYNPVNSFLFGDDRRLADAQRSKIIYPFLGLEIPFVSRKKETTELHRKTYNGAFVILSNAAIDDYQLQDDLLILHDQHVDEVIDMITRGFDDPLEKKRKPLIPRGCSIFFGDAQPYCAYEADDLWGWRQEFKISGITACFQVCNVHEPQGICCVLTSDFTWQTDGTKLTFTDNSAHNDSQKNEWQYREHCGNWTTEVGGDLVLDMPGHQYLEVILKTQDADCKCCKWSRFLILCSDKPGCGRSYPWRAFDLEGGPAQINPGAIENKEG